MNNDPRRAEEHFQRGNLFDEKGQSDRAIKEWQEAIRLNPDYAEAHYNLGIAYADAGNNKLAREELSEVIRLRPSDLDAQRELARILLEQGDVVEVAAQLRQIVDARPHDREAIHLLAEAYLAQSKLADATRTLDAIGSSADDADWLFELGKSHEHEHQRAQALWAYQRAVAIQPKYREAILGVERLTRFDAGSNETLAATHLQRANQFDENGDSHRAIEEWQEAIALDPNCTEAHYNLGIAYADEGHPDLAITELREVIRLEPLDPDARRELAEVYLETERFEAAINELRQILNIAPDATAAHLLAQTYFDLGRWDEAVGALESGALLEQDADLWFELGKAYELHQHRLDDAILAYRRAVIANPEHVGARDALRRLNVQIEEPPDEDADAFEEEG